MEAGGRGFSGRKVSIALPGVGAGLEAGGVFQVEARCVGTGLVFEVVGKESGFDPGAVLLADGLGVVEIAEMSRGCGPGAVNPGTEDEKVLVVGVVRFEGFVFELRSAERR